MKPSVAHIKHLSALTGKSKDFVKVWFAKKRNMQLGQCILSKNQIPLALLFFKSNPKPSIPEYEALSRILKAEKLAIFRYFNNKRKHFKIKISLEYSEVKNKKLEKAFEKCYGGQPKPEKLYENLSFEKTIEIAKETDIDEIKVDNWFISKRNELYYHKRFEKSEQRKVACVF